VYQQIVQLLTTLWEKHKSSFLIAVLVSIVWYFVPRAVNKGDAAQDKVISMQAEQINELKHLKDSFRNLYILGLQEQRDELRRLNDTVSKIQEKVVK
jgi:hypothetical protein